MQALDQNYQAARVAADIENAVIRPNSRLVEEYRPGRIEPE